MTVRLKEKVGGVGSLISMSVSFKFGQAEA
jgi:hypothetical protein